MWDLKMWPAYNYVLSGPDQAKRNNLWKEVISQNLHTKCLQVGVYGPEKIAPHFVSLDLYDTRPVVEIREDLAHTSFKDETFDLIVCNAILEHAKDPMGCVKEMWRIAKQNATVWVEIPFVQPYHPRKDYKLEDGYLCEKTGGDGDIDHGGDYWRWTPQGTVLLMKPFIMTHLMLVNEGGVCFVGKK